MKYIRTTTPTNIHSLTPTFIVDRRDFACFKTHGNKGRYVNDTLETEENLEKWLKYNKTSILKGADTIEELCDEFVIFNSNGICVGIIGDYKTAKYKCPYKSTIYGAIWTDKGLIYVAKMNDKGELELL